MTKQHGLSIVLSLTIAAILTIAALTATADPPTPVTATMQVYFSPHGGCADAIITQMSAATATIDVTSYELTSKPLADALIAAKTRGITIRVVTDRVQETNQDPSPIAIAAAGIQTRTDRNEKLQHNKYLIIDAQTTITGSYNWSNNAEAYNAENLVVIQSSDVATLYEADFMVHWNHSQPYVAKKPRRRSIYQPQAISRPSQTQPTSKGP